MKDVLQNQAHWLLLQYCGAKGIDTSGSHIEKRGRGFTYGLVNDSDGKVFAQITFTKTTVPQYWWGDAARKRGVIE